MQSAALREYVRAPTLPVCTPATPIHVVTVATRVRSEVQTPDNTFLTWFKVYWELGVGGRYPPFPGDFTHLIIVIWLCRDL